MRVLTSPTLPAGGPLSADGAVGKQFNKDGAIGGKVQEASDQAWDAGKETKARS